MNETHLTTEGNTMTKISIITHDGAGISWKFTDDVTKAQSNFWDQFSMFMSYSGYFITVGDKEIVFCMGIISDRALYDVYAEARGLKNGMYMIKACVANTVRSGEFTLDNRGLRMFGLGPTYKYFDRDFLVQMTDSLKEKFGVTEVFVGGPCDR